LTEEYAVDSRPDGTKRLVSVYGVGACWIIDPLRDRVMFRARVIEMPFAEVIS